MCFRKWKKQEEPQVMYGSRRHGKTIEMVGTIKELLRDKDYFPCGIKEPALLLGTAAYRILMCEVPLYFMEVDGRRVKGFNGIPIFVTELKPNCAALGEKKDILLMLEHLESTEKVMKELYSNMLVTSVDTNNY